MTNFVDILQKLNTEYLIDIPVPNFHKHPAEMMNSDDITMSLHEINDNFTRDKR